MHDVVIAGGGLCGLAVAESLEGKALSVLLLEGRQRLGGRILTRTSVRNGLAFDLGAAWFWPEAQPMIRELAGRLGLSTHKQHDVGKVLILRDIEKGPQDAGSDPVHGGAFRFHGGAGALIAALAERLATTEIRVGQHLTSVIDRADHVELRVRTGDEEREIRARRLVLALPPRSIAATVKFDPPLSPAVMSAMARTPTWMAS